MTEQLDYRGKPRAPYQTVNEMESRTIQSDAPKADIQKIIDSYRRVGIVEHLNQTEARFADVSEHDDYAQLMRTVRQAEVEFMKLPSKVREEFNHDVSAWLDAAHDVEKRDALVEEGVIEAPEGGTAEPSAVPIDPTPAE